MTCGVPQGSFLGLLLWNIGYDWVQRGDYPVGVEVTRYADDILVTACGKYYQRVILNATTSVAQEVRRMCRLGQKVTLNKCEAI